MTMIRSVGWNLGTLRELAGGVKDIPASARGLLKGQGITDRTAYALFGLPIVTGLFGAMYQYLATGKGPDDSKDYFFPKTGTTNKDGSADRVVLPSYVKDVAHLANRIGEGPLRVLQNVGEMAKGKVHPAISATMEMLMNKDFFDKPIRNPSDPVVKQTMDTLRHAVGGFEPFSLRGQTEWVKGKSVEKEMSTGQRVQQFFGITPAPAYIRRSDEEQLKREMRQRKTIPVVPGEHR